MNIEDSHRLQFPEVVVVEASAGSGKTYALAKRYLQLLIGLKPDSGQIPLRTILAITFTNKATVEMKERILDLLKKIALQVFSSKQEEEDILAFLGIDRNNACGKAGIVMDEIIKHYNFFQVQTIDSFINALLLGSALGIERSASFKIKRDYGRYLSYCLDLAIEEAAIDRDVFDFLEEFLEHYLFVENRQGWFPKDDILELMRSLFKLSNKYGESFIVYEGQSKDVIKKKKYIYQKIQELAGTFPEGMNANSKKYIRDFLDKNRDTFGIAALPSAFKKAKVPMNKQNKAPDSFNKLWNEIRRNLKELIELDATVAYNPYVLLFRRLLDFLQLASKKEDVLFLEELNHKARLLIDKEGITVAEVYYRLATRFRHYLIDEFQDTSVLQWRNLYMMVEEALSSGGSFFYVGDKKQAIYRFRGGEVRLFDAVREGFERFNVRPAYLTKNWRSQKAIVDFNNKVFSADNLTRALGVCGITEELSVQPQATDEITGIFKDAEQQYRPENKYGYVRVEPIDEKSQKQRDSNMQPRILKLINELKTRFNYEDIAILTRDNNEVELVTAWLLKEAVPVESEKTLNVIENPLIKEIIALLKFLYSPIDDLSFAAFILGEVFSCATRKQRADITEFIFRLHKEDRLRSGVSLYTLFRGEFSDIWDEYIGIFLKNVGLVSGYELLISIYQRFEVMANFKQSQAFFMKFLELLKAKEDECVGLSEFLLYLEDAPGEDLYVNVVHRDSVKVLTIHKSKGLEFPVVIIPFLRMDINPETGGKGTKSYVIEKPDQLLGLVRITNNHRAYSEQLQKTYAESYKKSCIDELNNMYVALTRAQYELYIFIPKKSASGNNKAYDIIPQDLTKLGARRSYATKQKDSQPLIDISPSQYKDWIASLSDESTDASSIQNRESLLRGNVIHFALSSTGNLNKQNKVTVIKAAVKDAKVRYPAWRDFTSVEDKISLIVDNERLQQFFYVSDGRIYREKEIVSAFGDTKRVDRLIVKQNEVWIVDYKSAPQRGIQHRKQMQEYIGIIKDIYHNREVKGYLLYLDTLSLEEVNG